MSQFYQKYKQLFEHDDYLNLNQAFEYGYPKNTQQPPIKQPQQPIQQQIFTQHTYQNPQPIQQYSPPRKYNNNYEQPQQEQQQQRFNKYINTPPRQYAKQESPIISNNNIPTTNNSRPSRNDELRYRKQVVQDNIFTPTPTPVPVSYNNIPQQQSAPVDILDVYVPKRIATAVVAPVEINIHRTYMQKMNDLDQLRKRYVDSKQLTNQLDPSNPYKYSLQKRILAQLGVDRKQRLRGLLQQ